MERPKKLAIFWPCTGTGTNSAFPSSSTHKCREFPPGQRIFAGDLPGALGLRSARFDRDGITHLRKARFFWLCQFFGDEAFAESIGQRTRHHRLANVFLWPGVVCGKVVGPRATTAIGLREREIADVA